MTNQPTHRTWRSTMPCRMSVALSGGGHRASAWGLGALYGLLSMRDAEAAKPDGGADRGDRDRVGVGRLADQRRRRSGAARARRGLRRRRPRRLPRVHRRSARDGGDQRVDPGEGTHRAVRRRAGRRAHRRGGGIRRPDGGDVHRGAWDAGVRVPAPDLARGRGAARAAGRDPAPPLVGVRRRCCSSPRPARSPGASSATPAATRRGSRSPRSSSAR